MERPQSYFLLFLLWACMAAALMQPCSSSAETCAQWVAKAVSVQGTVEVKRMGGTLWQAVKLNDTFCAGDMIRVLERSRADLALANRPLLRLDQDTTITLKGLQAEKTSLIDMLKGVAHFFSRTPKSVEVNTGFVNAGIEGTEFLVRVEESKALITVYEGKVLASNQAGSLAISSGQSAVAEAGKAPELRVVVRPRDAVQWALYYPPVLYYRPEDFRGLSESDQSMLRGSIEAYSQRNITAAFDRIDGLPDRSRDPRLFTYRASLLLAVGRADEANADIEKALTLSPNDSDALALQSVIAVVQNEKGKALDLARKAVDADPKSASARTALSYAQQASFDLEGARNSLKEAVQLSPENALAWARLAEIWLSFGELKKALEAAQKAVSLNPDLSRTQTVLGFAYLTQVNTAKSMEAFQKAILFDQADPLPRLGLGLAKIREGGLPKWEKELMKMIDDGLMEGTKDLEIAVSLDPDNALVRSYLGKAYYEKTQDKLATDQFEMAKKLDPSDPTPYFYAAIEKQTTNRPVEALQDFEKAIELNDNRAVYRSKLLLDADLAARSAAVARIYVDLGFQQRGLVEGWKSVNADPADYSGHRFLADTYAALPRHEIARVSELLQSQLLQPLNMTPIQPRLAESSLFLISSQGPANLSFNEFNPLFSRNGVTFQGSLLGGENSTFAGEAVLSGIYNRASFSFGYDYFDTDGWRKNADEKDQIVNAFLQYELSPQTSIQGEFRYRNTENGDLALRFFEDDFSPNLRTQQDRTSVRLGFRQNLWQGSDLIGNFMYQHENFKTHYSPDTIYVYIGDSNEPKAFSGELQHLFRSKYFNLVSGVGYFNIDWEDTFLVKFNLPPIITFPPRIIETDIDHTNIYLYSYINYLKSVTFTIGLSGDFIRGGATDENQVNPKFGITWNPLSDTTLRGAVFRTFKRTLITDQTLEPTQVAGFNQFFDDFDETDAWTYGAAIDQKFAKSVYGGAEFYLRDLEFPFRQVIGPAPGVYEEEWHERIARAYLYWTPYKWFGLTSEYMYERIKRDEALALGLREVDTHRVPLGINFYHPCGLSALLKATYIYQKGQFERQFPFTTGMFEEGDDQFWLFDAAISYRLPKRYGFITVGVRNLFDQSFKYYDTDLRNPAIQPDRFFYGKITLALP